MANNAKTGIGAIVLEWFQLHSDQVMTIHDIAEEFGITRVMASNTLGHLTRKNALIRAEGVGAFRLRQPDEKREEFKVARPIPKPPKTPEVAYPVLKEFDPEFLSPITRQVINRQYSTAAQKGRIQYLDANSFIVWNSEAQLTNIRQMAIGY